MPNSVSLPYLEGEERVLEDDEVDAARVHGVVLEARAGEEDQCRVADHRDHRQHLTAMDPKSVISQHTSVAGRCILSTVEMTNQLRHSGSPRRRRISLKDSAT
jgi:hypothetical protein